MTTAMEQNTNLTNLKKILYTLLEQRESNNHNFYVTINTKMAGDLNKDGSLYAENIKTLEKVKQRVEEAVEMKPEALIFYIAKTMKESKSKMDKRVWVVNPPEPEMNEADIVRKEFAVEFEKFKKKVNSTNPEGLGSLGEMKFQYETDKLRSEMDIKLERVEHKNMLDEKQREIDELTEKLESELQFAKKLEQDQEILVNKHEILRKNRFTLNGVDTLDLVAELGGKVLTSLVKQNAGAVSKLSGVPKDAILSALNSQEELPAAPGAAGTTVVEEENTLIDQIVNNIREMLSTWDEERIKKFYSLMVVIAQDQDNLDLILEFALPKTEDNAS